jgi:hypothetical protein
MAKAVARTATEALKMLWSESFFRAAKNWAGIAEKLAQRGNHFNKAELGMALKRAPYLTRRGKPGSFEYIQKYPFVADGALSLDEKRPGRNGRTSRRATGS